jgi:hypothetical protein
MSALEFTPRPVLRTVLIVVAVVLIVYVLYLLRKPLGWLVVAALAYHLANRDERLPRKEPEVAER